MKKTLLIYYTYTGTTRKIAQRLSRMGSYDLEEIHESRPRQFGIRGYLQAGYESLTKQGSNIENLYHDLDKYEHIVIGTPVWAGHMAPPIRSFLEDNRHKIKSISLFCTYEGSGGIDVLNEMAELIGAPVMTSFAFSNETIQNPTYLDKRIEGFVSAWTSRIMFRKPLVQTSMETSDRDMTIS